jgi:hypothetical protein
MHDALLIVIDEKDSNCIIGFSHEIVKKMHNNSTYFHFSFNCTIIQRENLIFNIRALPLSNLYDLYICINLQRLLKGLSNLMSLFKFMIFTIKFMIYLLVEKMNLISIEYNKRYQRFSVGNFLLMQLTKPLMTNTSNSFAPLKVMITFAVFKLVDLLLRRLECNYLFGSSLPFKNKLEKFDQTSP